MRIESIKIINYKSFLESEVIKFTPGFNVIVGKNNSGKTALLETLSLNFENIPHLSKHTKPETDSLLSKPASIAEITFQVSQSEWKSKLANHPQQKIQIYQDPNTPEPQQLKNINQAFLANHLSIQVTYQSKTIVDAYFLPQGRFKSKNAFEFDISNLPDKNPELRHPNVGPNDEKNISRMIAPIYEERVFSLVAQRYNVGQSNVGVNTKLENDASNLPEALSNLKTGIQAHYTQYLEHVTTIFPEISEIPIFTIDQERKSKIHLSTDGERSDLAIPLQNSGTGIGQVLAMLFAITNTNFPQTFIIDEPQSFLHPGAVKKLFNILNNDFPQHQYIITTHSPAAIIAAQPNNIIQLTKEDSETKANIIDLQESNQMRSMLRDIGASFSDVFGADRVLWVEGKTEETCFPLIINQLSETPLLGTEIVGVLHTDDITSTDKKTAKSTIRIYNKLTNTPSPLLPPSTGFIFDRENKTEDEITEIKKMDSTIHFVKRKMYENYLLNPQALEYLIASLDNFSNPLPTANDIEDWAETHKWDEKYIDSLPSEEGRTQEYWIIHGHSAKLLNDMFKTLSNKRYEYYKIDYGLRLTQWILENSPEELQEIADLIDKVLEESNEIL